MSSDSTKKNETCLPPLGMGAVPAGFGVSAIIQHSDTLDKNKVALAQLVKEILADPLAMAALSDRVYQLMQDDLRIQQERNRGFGRRF